MSNILTVSSKIICITKYNVVKCTNLKRYVQNKATKYFLLFFPKRCNTKEEQGEKNSGPLLKQRQSFRNNKGKKQSVSEKHSVIILQ